MLHSPHLRRLHRGTALLLGVFLTLHLIHHATLIGGTDLHLTVQALISPIYRWRPVEVLLLTAFALQIGTGILQGLRPRTTARGWRRAQILSGLVLGGFILAHVGAALNYRASGLETTVHFAASGMFHPILKWFFYLYYPAGLIALATHLAAVLALRRTGPAWLPLALPVLAAVYAGVVLTGLGGGFGGPLPASDYLYHGSILP